MRFGGKNINGRNYLVDLKEGEKNCDLIHRTIQVKEQFPMFREKSQNQKEWEGSSLL